MEKTTYKKICAIVYDYSGITLGPQKEALVSARVAKRMRALSLATHEDYLKYLKQQADGSEEFVKLLDAMSTNTTNFFRESHHFDILASEFKKWQAAGQKRFRFWSAASSTGEEPYSITMTLLENMMGRRGLDVRLLATDISTEVLDTCRAGVYSEQCVAPISSQLRAKYFQLQNDKGNKAYKVTEGMRNLVLFKRMNLSKPPFPLKGPLDLVFCRNVMIYFDRRVRVGLLNEVARLLKPGGLLFVGHAESLTGLNIDLKYVKPSVYMK